MSGNGNGTVDRFQEHVEDVLMRRGAWDGSGMQLQRPQSGRYCAITIGSKEDKIQDGDMAELERWARSRFAGWKTITAGKTPSQSRVLNFSFA